MTYDPNLQRLLETDALALAESITGKSYKEDDATMREGFALHLAATKLKKERLQQAGDSHMGMSFLEYLNLLVKYGFKLAHVEEFDYEPSYNPGEHRKETFVILWHPDGLLGTVTSYMGQRLNSSTVYYNVAFEEEFAMTGNCWQYTSSGCFLFERNDYKNGFTGVWVGDHDGRQGIINALEGLRTVGEFLPVWLRQPHLWLIHYGDEHKADELSGGNWSAKSDFYDKKNAERIALLPQYIQDAIKGDEDYS